MSEVTASGFVRTRLDERLAALQTAMQAIFGPDIVVDADSIDGQTLGIFAESISNLDQLAEDVYQGFSPQSASGLALSRLVQLNGIRRIAGQYSTASVNITGIPGVVIPAGSLVGSSTLGTTVQFATTQDVTIGAGGTASVPVQATSFGAIAAPLGTLDRILSPTYGWQTVTNPSAAIPGRAEETDEELRLRRAQSTSTPAVAIVDGIYGSIANLTGVKSARVYENDTPNVNANGQAPYSIYAVVDGGTAADIAGVIFRKKTLGTNSLGEVSTVINDSQGFPHTVKFGRPTDVNVWITVVGNIRAGWPGDGVARIQAALVAFGQANFGIGQEVIQSRLFSAVNSVPGTSITQIFIGTAASPASEANLAIAYNQIARFDASRIVVNIT